MPHHPLRPWLLACASLLPAAAIAQSTPTSPIPKLSDIVVTASRHHEPLSDTVGDVSIIGREELQRAPGQTIAEILAQSPAVQLMSTGGPQTVTSIFLRGTDTKHTLVLVDGIRVNSPTTGGVEFPTIDPALIDHIEILRGAASSLYGSDAIGGVINIVTRKALADQPISAWVNAGYGSDDTAKTSLGLSGAAAGWDYQLSTSAETSRGFDSQRPRMADGTPNPNWSPDRDGYSRHSFSGSLGWRWAPGHRLAINAYNSYLRGDYDTANYDVFPAVPIANAQAKTRQQVYTLTSTDAITDRWDSTLTLGFSGDAMDDIAQGRTTIRSINRQYTWINTFRPLKDHRVSLLLERKEERVSANTHYVNDERNTNAAGLIYQGRFGPLRTQASVRNDNYTGYGNQSTGSLGADLAFLQNWEVGVAANTAFHAPTFNELYWPLSFGFKGNPDLRPEKSRNIEAHIGYDNGQTRLKATVYQNRIRDLIATVCDSFFNCTTQNVNQATVRGLTLTASHTIDQTTLYADADFLDPRNDDPEAGRVGSTLPHRARQILRTGVTQSFGALRLGAQYQYTGNRYDDVANRVRLGGYSLVNLSASYDFSKSFSAQLRWNNVLDKDYVLVDGYNTPGSTVFLNLSWRM